MNKLKYKKIALTLESNIKNNVYNDKLPPVRTLVKDFGVGNPTMNKALKILTQKGLIIPSGPKGNIISKKKIIRPKTNIVSIIYGYNSLDPNLIPMFKELKLKAEADGYRTLFINMLDPNVFNEGDFWSSNWVDGYIFTYSSINKELAYKLRENNVPYIVSNRMPPEFGAHWVDFNIEKTLKTFMETLVEAGHKRIIFAFSKISLPSYRSYIKQVWSDIQKEFSKVCSGKLLYLPSDDIRKSAFECAKQFSEFNADAIISLGVSPLLIESELDLIGKKNIKDYSLIYIDNEMKAPFEKFSHALASYKALADNAWDLFKKIVKNPEIEAQNVLIDEEIFLDRIVSRKRKYRFPKCDCVAEI
jgi:DNA-binding LacI/PurR family transcriptional regulator